MASGSDRVSIKLNVFDGTIEIDASSADFQLAVDKAKELAVATQLGSRPHATPAPEAPNTLAPANHQPPAPSAGDSAPAPSTSSAQDRKPKAARSSGGSQGRPGRIGSFEPVKFGLSEADERALRDFFKEKAPVEQGHQVAVAMMKGEEILGRQGLEYNEIYTLMYLGGIKPLPKAIDVVLGKLAGENWVVREGKTFSLKFVGRDFVTENLSPQKAP